MKFKTIHARRFLFPALILVIGISAVSCRDFFMTSWFSWAARDPGALVPPVTTENIADVITTFEDNPDASLEVLKKIKDAADGLSDEEKNKLLGASLEAAVNAVGLGQTVLNAAGNLGSIENVDDIRSTLGEALNSLSNLEETNGLLVDMLPMPADCLHPEDDPAFMAFANEATADDLAMTAVVLILGETSKLSEGDFDNFINDPQDYIDNIPQTGTPAALAQAVAITSVLGDRADEITGPMKDILDQLKLIKP